VLGILHGEAKQRFADETDHIKMLKLGMAKVTTTVEGLASEITASNSKTRSLSERNRSEPCDEKTRRQARRTWS
jgi:hypothetical protein